MQILRLQPNQGPAFKPHQNQTKLKFYNQHPTLSQDPSLVQIISGSSHACVPLRSPAWRIAHTCHLPSTWCRLLLASHSAVAPGERGSSTRSITGLLCAVPLRLLRQVRGWELLPRLWHRLIMISLVVLLVVMRRLGRHLHRLVALLLLLLRPLKGMQALAGVGRCRRDGAMGGGCVPLEGRLGLRLQAGRLHGIPRGPMARCRGGAVLAVSLGPKRPAVQQVGGRGREHEGRGRGGGRRMADSATSYSASLHIRVVLLLFLLLGHWRWGSMMHESVQRRWWQLVVALLMRLLSGQRGGAQLTAAHCEAADATGGHGRRERRGGNGLTVGGAHEAWSAGGSG